MARALYPGTFDPIHNGHIDIAVRASALFDEVVMAIYDAPPKKLLFETAERLELARDALGFAIRAGACAAERVEPALRPREEAEVGEHEQQCQRAQLHGAGEGIVSGPAAGRTLTSPLSIACTPSAASSSSAPRASTPRAVPSGTLAELVRSA